MSGMGGEIELEINDRAFCVEWLPTQVYDEKRDNGDGLCSGWSTEPSVVGITELNAAGYYREPSPALTPEEREVVVKRAIERVYDQWEGASQAAIERGWE